MDNDPGFPGEIMRIMSTVRLAAYILALGISLPGLALSASDRAVAKSEQEVPAGLALPLPKPLNRERVKSKAAKPEKTKSAEERVPVKRTQKGFEKDIADKSSKARSALKDFRTSARESARLRNNALGRAGLADNNDPDRGVEHFKRAEKLDPKDPVAVTGVSHAMALKGDIKGALAKLTAAARRDPEHRISYISSRVSLYTKLGMYEEALRDSEEVLKADLTVPSYWRNHARLLVKMGRYQEAGQSYDKGNGLDNDKKPFMGDRDFCSSLKDHGVASASCEVVLARKGPQGRPGGGEGASGPVVRPAVMSSP